MWGFTRLARGPEILMNHVGYVTLTARIGLIIELVAITGSMALLSRQAVSLYGRCAISMFMFVWLIPGFGVQYLAWPVPFALFFGAGWTLAVYTSSALFLFFVYDNWAGASPGTWPRRNRYGPIAWCLLS